LDDTRMLCVDISGYSLTSSNASRSALILLVACPKVRMVIVGHRRTKS